MLHIFMNIMKLLCSEFVYGNACTQSGNGKTRDTLAPHVSPSTGIVLQNGVAQKSLIKGAEP